jgi:tetratricopeptide (TPR) repeat protein
MVHRDLKPSNLMLSTDGRVIVLDFGLVKTTSDRSVTATGSLLGTYRYMSPEQVGAKRIKIDARSDVYSLGVTLYELLTFRPAFEAVEQSELLSQVLFKEPVAPRRISPSVPQDLQTICLTAMEKAPQHRYQTARAMAEDLDSYLRDQVIVARPQGPVRRAVKFVRRRRVESIAGAAILCTLVAGVWGYYFHGKAQEAERDGLMKEGITAWERRDFETAAGKFRDVLSTEPRDYAALVNLAGVLEKEYYTRKDKRLLNEACALLDRAIAVEPERLEARNTQGVIYQALNRPADAIAAYDKIRQLDEQYYPAWVNLAMLYAEQGEIETAERCAERGVELSREENAPMPLRILAAIQLHLGRDETSATLQAARAASQDQPGTTLLRTLLLQSQHELKRGRSDRLGRALDLAVTANGLLGVEESDDLEPAGKTALRARVKRLLALARLRHREWEAAATAAEQALAADSDCAVAHLVLAIAHAHLHDAEAARANLRAAEAAWPEELKQGELHVTQDGESLWFNTASELRALQEEARGLLEEPSAQ